MGPSTYAVLAAAIGILAPSPAQADEELLLTPLSQITVSSWAYGSEAPARLDGDRLVIPRGGGGVSVYDVSHPAHPVEIATVDVATLEDQGGASALTPDGRLVTALPIRQTLAVIDISHRHPRKLGEFGGVASPFALGVSYDALFAWVGSDSANIRGVYSFDLDAPLPVATGSYPVVLTDSGFLMRDDVVYFAGTPSGPGDSAVLDIVDMNVPSTPVELGTWPSETPGNIVGIDVDGDRIALAAYWGGIWLLDASDPAAMRLLDHEDWTDSRIYSTGVALMPPFVLLLQSGPAPELRQLDLLRMHDDGTLEWLDPLPLDAPPMAILHEGSLVIVQTSADDDGDGAPDSTTLALYTSDVRFFHDGFDG
jgi:hypothetical protein